MTKEYIGTKRVLAKPMNRRMYNKYRGWELPINENGDDEGYLVEYLDIKNSNHPLHIGYISWSPKEQFEDAYDSLLVMNFGHALEIVKDGHFVARKGWNGRGMFVYYNHGRGSMKDHLCLRCVDGESVPWLASQTDLLADDWYML